MVKDGGTKGYLVYSESKEEEKEIKEGSRLNGKKKMNGKKGGDRFRRYTTGTIDMTSRMEKPLLHIR